MPFFEPSQNASSCQGLACDNKLSHAAINTINGDASTSAHFSGKYLIRYVVKANAVTYRPHLSLPLRLTPLFRQGTVPARLKRQFGPYEVCGSRVYPVQRTQMGIVPCTPAVGVQQVRHCFATEIASTRPSSCFPIHPFLCSPHSPCSQVGSTEGGPRSLVLCHLVYILRNIHRLRYRPSINPSQQLLRDSGRLLGLAKRLIRFLQGERRPLRPLRRSRVLGASVSDFSVSSGTRDPSLAFRSTIFHPFCRRGNFGFAFFA